MKLDLVNAVAYPYFSPPGSPHPRKHPADWIAVQCDWYLMDTSLLDLTRWALLDLVESQESQLWQ